MNKRILGHPTGQSLIELMMLLALLSAMLLAVMIIGTVGLAGMKTSQAARFSAFDCDNHPGFCRELGITPIQKIKSAIFYSDRREVFPSDMPEWKPVKSLGRNQQVLQGDGAVSVAVDLPKVDGADKSLLARLSDLFRSLSLKAGPAIFNLPSPDQLSRSTVKATLWDSSGGLSVSIPVPRLELSSRVALVSDSWAASDRSDFFSRVKEGETPLSLASQAIEGLYLPGKDILMPVLDVLGLEANTSTFRAGFHRADHDVAYPGSRITVR